MPGEITVSAPETQHVALLLAACDSEWREAYCFHWKWPRWHFPPQFPSKHTASDIKLGTHRRGFPSCLCVSERAFPIKTNLRIQRQLGKSQLFAEIQSRWCEVIWGISFSGICALNSPITVSEPLKAGQYFMYLKMGQILPQWQIQPISHTAIRRPICLCSATTHVQCGEAFWGL